MDHQALLKRVRTIELKTRGLTQQVFSGEYQSAFKGRGMSFSEVRNYQFGDDVRSIDWNVTARFQEPYVKIFEEERELTVLLIIDLSGSMYFGQTDDSKFTTAVEAAATLAFSAAKKNDKVGAIFVTDKVEKYIPAEKGVKHVYAMMKALIYFQPNQAMTDLNAGMKYAVNVHKKRCICFLISDFMDVPSIKDGLVTLSRKHDLVALQLEDDGESSLPDVGFVQWINAETGRTTWVDTSSTHVRHEYAQRQQKRKEVNKEIFDSLGIDTCVLKGGNSIFMPLMHLFKQRK
ncbi:MAG: DUF58 domain-containing protein [Bacteroidota bacterium]